MKNTANYDKGLVASLLLGYLDEPERRTYSCLACSREMGVMTRAAYEAAGQECGECEPWTPEER